jgi:hypothetical protein
VRAAQGAVVHHQRNSTLSSRHLEMRCAWSPPVMPWSIFEVLATLPPVSHACLVAGKVILQPRAVRMHPGQNASKLKRRSIGGDWRRNG